MDRTNSIRRGFATLSEITEYSLDGYEPIDPITNDIVNADRALQSLLVHPTGHYIALRMCVAILNTKLAKSGHLLSLEDNGSINHSYHCADTDRKALVDLIFGN